MTVSTSSPSSALPFAGRVAIVTGGSSGIGAATAIELAERGAAVAVIGRDEARTQTVAEEVRSRGVRGLPVILDVGDTAACREAVARIVDELGRLDFLINSAASFISKGLDAVPDDWNRVLATNVQGCSNMVQACHPHLRVSDAAAVVNVSSISAHIAQPNRWTYNTTKAAIVMLTKCQALDLSADGIRVNVVSPGWIWTPEVARAAGGDRNQWEPLWGKYHMLRRLGEAGEVANAIAFLCSVEASFITAAELPVDGGYLGLGSEGLGTTSVFSGSD